MTVQHRKIPSKDKIETFSRIVKFTSAFFEHVIGATLDAVENEFLIKSDISDSDSNKLSSMTRAIEIKKNKRHILNLFRDELIQILTCGFNKNNQTEQEDDFGLSLMDEAEIQENLLIDNLAYRVSEQCQPLLQAITKGIVRISGDLKIPPEPLALSPAKIGGTFQTSIACLRLPFAYKPLIYNVLFTNAFTKLQELYSGILTLLIESGIIDATDSPIKPTPELLKTYKAETDPHETQENLDDTIDTDDDPNDYTISDMTASDGTLDIGLAELIKQSHTIQQKPGKPIPAAGIDQNLFQKNSSTRLLYELLTHPQQNPTRKDLQNASLPEIMFFLSKLQTELGSPNTPFKHPRAVSQSVDQALICLHSSINRRLSDIEFQVIQLINRCFIALLDDKLLPEPLKIQISRLQIPYIKAALLDATLLIDETHSCRLLLDEIAQLGIGATQIEHAEYTHIHSAVQYLVDRFDSDLKLFKDSYKKLRKLRKTAEEKAMIREHKCLPKAEQQANLQFRKLIISRVLREALREKHFPKELHTLTLKGFTKVLDQRFMKSGINSPEFKDAIKLFCYIVESIQTRKSVQELHHVFERIPRFIAKTRSMLLEVYSKPNSRKLLSGLESFYLERARLFKEQLDQLDATPVLEDESAVNKNFDINNNKMLKQCMAAIPSPSDILSRIPSYIQTGTWFDIYTGHDTQPHRLKLVSIIEDTAQLIFMNINNKEILIKPADELIEQIDCERSRKIDAQNLFNRALAIAITNMQLSKN